MAETRDSILLLSRETILQFNRIIYSKFGWDESFYNDHSWEDAIFRKDSREIQSNLKTLLDNQKDIAASADFIGMDNLPLHKEQKRTPALDSSLLTKMKRDTNDFILYLECLINNFPESGTLPISLKFQLLIELGLFETGTTITKLRAEDRNIFLSEILGCSIDTARHLYEEIGKTGNLKYRGKLTDREQIKNKVSDAKKRV